MRTSVLLFGLLAAFNASAAVAPGFHREYLWCRGSSLSDLFIKHADASCASGDKTFALRMDGRGATGGVAFRRGYVIATIADGDPLEKISGSYRGLEFGLSVGIGGYAGLFARAGDQYPLYAAGFLFGGIGDLSSTEITITAVRP